MSLTGEFQDKADLQAQNNARRLRDHDDLQNEIAGRETGRQSRFLNASDERGGANGKKRKSLSERIRETLDWLLLNDAEYTRIHSQAMSVLGETENATERALAKITDAIAREETVLADMEDRAARLEDGTLVFRKANGDIVTAEGKAVPDDLTAGIIWRGDEPGFEEYAAQQQRIDDLHDSANELRGIETELGAIRGELTDNETPASKERMGDLKDRIEALQEQSSSTLTKHFDEPTVTTAIPNGPLQQSSAMAIPTMPSGSTN